MRVITTSVTVGATPQEVWQVLVDLPRYPEWNPFITQAEGEVRPGGSLAVFIRPPGDAGMTHHPVVQVADPGRCLQWLGTAVRPWVFSARHEFLLEPCPGGTLLTHRERFTGALVPFLRRTLNRTEQGFAAMNEALRERVEAQVGR